MEPIDQTTREEQLHFEETIETARREIDYFQTAIEEIEQEMLIAKEDTSDNYKSSDADMSNPDNFDAFLEFAQNMTHVDKLVSNHAEYHDRIKAMQAIIRAPYFARIDFEYEEGDVEKIYIGRRALSDRKTKDPLIFDWRAPISSVFYRFMSGPAFYDAPYGRIEGELLLKRQFEIKDGKLEFFFDADREISDGILRQLLSRNTSPKMKAIVETIQSEQDTVIRDMENDLLMVQGVAGSGKTSIALHRAAYLMYQGLSSRLTADSILILSPNTTFEDYIAEVLPELGEDNVKTAIFRDLLTKVIRDYYVEPYHEYLEHVMAGKKAGKTMKRGMELKTSEHYLELLNFFLEEIPQRYISYQDIDYNDKCVMTADEMKDWLCRRPYVPLGTRLKQLHNHLTELAFGVDPAPGLSEEILRFSARLDEILKLDIVKLYREFLLAEEYMEELQAEFENIHVYDRIVKRTMICLDNNRIPYEDAFAIAYLTLKIFEGGRNRGIKQVVIDEAQDYYPIQFEILSLCFPNARFTVLGDVNQTLAKQENLSFYQSVQAHLHKEKASLITLNKSFRCTSEILQYSLQFLDKTPDLTSFNRPGDLPLFTAASSDTELVQHLQAEIGTCVSREYHSICLLTKSAESAGALYNLLSAQAGDLPMAPKLVSSKMDTDLTGLLIMPVYLSKGLEFDAVSVCDVDAAHYHTEDDRKLLYVSCTRALHRLALFCVGEKSPLVK